MKALSFLLVSFFVCVASFASPVFSNSIDNIYSKTFPDLSKDKDFVNSIDQILTLQGSVNEDAYKKLYASVIAIKSRYAELNDQASASIMINAGIDKLVKQGKINYNSTSLICLRQLYAAIVVCIRTSTSFTAFLNCVHAAYDQFQACLDN